MGLVERVLISVYPQEDETAKACARKLIAVALSGLVELEWQEARRLAAQPVVQGRTRPALHPHRGAMKGC